MIKVVTNTLDGKTLTPQEKGEMEVKLSAVLMSDYLKSNRELSEKEFIKETSAKATDLTSNPATLDRHFNTMISTLESSKRSMMVSREVPVMAQEQGKDMKQAVTAHLKEHAGQKSTRIAELEKDKIGKSLGKFTKPASIPLPRAHNKGIAE